MGDEMEDFDGHLSNGAIIVLRNFQRYPLPKNADIPGILRNIRSVLRDEYHFDGFVEFMAYGLQHDQDKSYSSKAECSWRYYPDDTTMIHDILYCTRNATSSYRWNIALIAKENQEDRELLRILKCLASRIHTIFLVEPPEEDSPFEFRNAELLEGSTRNHQIEDFSLPLQPISTPKAGFFWDAKDYLFPDEDRDPDLIYDKIQRYLEERDFDAKLSIWAYVDENEEYWKDKLFEKTWNASIYFLPRGDGRRMLHDVILWLKDNPEAYDRGWAIIIANKRRSCDKPFFDWLSIGS